MRDANAALIEAYRHDASGNRLGKHSGPDTIRYLYDRSGTLLGEYTGNAQPIAEYVYLDTLPVAVFTATGLAYIETDHLGTPRILIDAASHQTLWHWPLTGSAFGEHPPNQDPHNTGSPYTFNLRYPGQYYDTESGLHYNYFRDYEPQTGRYIQSDPIGLEGGVSTYGYVGGDPLVNKDPKGLVVWHINWGVGGGIGYYMVGASVYRLQFLDPLRGLACTYTVYCGGIGVGLPEFSLISPVIKWDDGMGDCGDCSDHEGFGAMVFGSAVAGIGISAGGYTSVPNGPVLRGDFINVEENAGVRIGAGASICRFELN